MCQDLKHDPLTNSGNNNPYLKTTCAASTAATVVTPNGHVVAQEDTEEDQCIIDLIDDFYKTPTKQRRHLKKKLF